MKIAITGGSGFVGSALARLLRERGNEVVALSRRDADVTKIETLSGLFNGCDCVVHLVGIIREAGRSFDEIVILGTANVVKECEKAGVKKIVYVSALGVSERREEKYYKTKIGAEREVIASGIPYSILRPSFVYGPGGGLTEKLKGLLSLPIFPVFGDGKYELQPIHVNDAAQCIANAIEKNGVFEIGGKEKITFEHLLSTLARSMGKRPVFIHIPLWIMRPIVSLMSIFPFFPITRGQLEMLTAGNVCGKNGAEELGVHPRSFGDGINFTKR